MLTRFEKARIIAARALQIAQGAPILVKVPEGVKEIDQIVRLELEKEALPLTVVREMPNKTKIFLNLKGEIIGKTEKQGS